MKQFKILIFVCQATCLFFGNSKRPTLNNAKISTSLAVQY